MMVSFRESDLQDTQTANLHICTILFGVVIQFTHASSVDCGYSVGGPLNRDCPHMVKDDRLFICLSMNKNCQKPDVYHCAKNETGIWTEVCAEQKMCEKGEEPFVTEEENVVCRLCANPEMYNPTATLSNKFSYCPRKKTKCSPFRHGRSRIECEDLNDNDKYTRDRRCRCNYEDNFIPRFYNFESYNWTCTPKPEDTEDLECYPSPCENMPDGRKQKMGQDYRCHPVSSDVNLQSTPTNRQRNFHTTVTEKQITQKKAILEKTTKASNGTGGQAEETEAKMSSTTSKQMEAVTINRDVLIGIVAGVIAIVVLAVVVVCYLRRKKTTGSAGQRKTDNGDNDIEQVQSHRKLPPEFPSYQRYQELQPIPEIKAKSQEISPKPTPSHPKPTTLPKVKGSKILSPPGTISSSQDSQEDHELTSIPDDNEKGKTQTQEWKTQSNGKSEVGSGEPVGTTGTIPPFKRKQDFEELLKMGKKCYEPVDLDKVLMQSKVDYEQQCKIERRLKQNCKFNRLKFLGETPRNGDCFFEAIVSQLNRLGAQESGVLTPLQLRLKVCEYIQQHPTFEGQEGSVSLANYMYIETGIKDYCEKMAKQGTWADHVVVITMARMLEYDIVIVTSSPSTSEEECLTWVIGDKTKKKPPLLLAHLWENHYQSLQPI